MNMINFNFFKTKNFCLLSLLLAVTIISFFLSQVPFEGINFINVASSSESDSLGRENNNGIKNLQLPLLTSATNFSYFEFAIKFCTDEFTSINLSTKIYLKSHYINSPPFNSFNFSII